MTVTDIVPLDNKRSKVYVDGEFAFILYRGEIRNYRLRTGEEISSPVFDEINNSLIPKRAKKRAMNLLQKRDYTEYKLREKLKEGFYTDEIIDDTIEYLKSYRYLDDEHSRGDKIADYESGASHIQVGITNSVIESRKL